MSDELKKALDLAADAAKRSISIFLLLGLVVALLAFTLWTESDSNWGLKRTQAAQDAVWVLTCQPELVYGSDVVTRVHAPVAESSSDKIDEERRDNMYRCSKGLSPAEQARGQNYIRTWDLSLSEAKKIEDTLLESEIKSSTLNLPGIGATIDANDLSLVAGMALAIILTLLYLVIGRQLANLRQVFTFANIQRDVTYSLMSMTEPLFRQHGKSKSRRLAHTLFGVPNVLIGFAVISQIMVIGDDLLTIRYSLVPNLVRVEMTASFLLCAYVLYRAVRCWSVLYALDSEWDKWSPIVRENK